MSRSATTLTQQQHLTRQLQQLQTLSNMSRSATTLTQQQHLTHQLQQLQALSKKVIQKKINEKKYSFQYLGITTTRQDIVKIFGDIRFIIIMGPESRAERMAKSCVTKLNIAKKYEIIGESEFFKIYKIGCILSCSHGMGISSVALFLNELLRLMQISQNNNFELLRFGSSGGIGIEGGTLIVTTHSIDPITMNPEWVYYSCGHKIKQECIYNSQMYKRLYAIAKAKKYKVEYGKTVSAETFYEAQGRIDGALCSYSEKDKFNYLNKLYNNGVRNFEMEAIVVSGICTRNSIKCGMISIALLNRLEGDSISAKYTENEIKSWMENGVDVLLQYIYQFVLKK